MEEQVHEFCKYGNVSKCFLAFFSWTSSLKNSCPYHKSFIVNYDKGGNLQSFLPWMIPNIHIVAITYKIYCQNCSQALNNMFDWIYKYLPVAHKCKYPIS